MPAKKYKVNLSEDERVYLKQLISTGKAAARKITHAQILIHAEEGKVTRAVKDTDIAKALHISHLTVEHVRKRFVEESIRVSIKSFVMGRCLFNTFMIRINMINPSKLKRLGNGV